MLDELRRYLERLPPSLTSLNVLGTVGICLVDMNQHGAIRILVEATIDTQPASCQKIRCDQAGDRTRPMVLRQGIARRRCCLDPDRAIVKGVSESPWT